MPDELNSTEGARRRERNAFIALAAVLFIYYFSSVAAFPFTEPDEGRYAGVAAEMVRSGNWLTPHHNGLRYYEKPPLFFWIDAAFLQLFGMHEWAARLPVALAAWLTSLLIYVFGKNCKNHATGMTAAVIYATIPMVAVVSRVVLVDPVLVLFTTLALFAAWRFFVQTESRTRTLNFYLFWAACAMAALVKGPVGVLLPLSSAGGYLLIRRDWRGILRFARPDGILVFLIICAPWYVLMEIRNPGYLYEFIVGQNFGRLLNAEDFGRSKPFWYYLPVLAGALLPWSAFFPLLIGLARRARAAADPFYLTLQFLACAFVFPLLLLSASGGKLAYYILPLCPPFAIALANALVQCVKDPAAPLRKYYISTGAFLGISGAAVLAVVNLYDFPEPIQPAGASRTYISDLYQMRAATLDAACLGAFFLLFLGGGWLLAARAARRAMPSGGLAVAAVTLLITFGALPWGVRSLAPLYSKSDLGDFIKNNARSGEPVVMYTEHVRTVAWALGRPVWLFHAPFSEFGHKFTKEELDGLSLERDKEKLKLLLREWPSALIVDNNYPGIRNPVPKLSPVRVTPLADFGRYTVWRAEK